MRSYPLTALQGGISRLRVKGAARANTLYDLTNAYLTQAGSIVPREGTIAVEQLDDTTVGLLAIDGVFNIFSSSSGATVPSSYTLNLLINPGLTTDTPSMIWFAKPFMGFPYVVCEFASGTVLHYWLQNDGEWTASSTYYTDNVIIPTTPNGLGYQAIRDMPINPTWAALTSTSAGAIVEPTEYTGFAYVAVTVSGPLPFTGSIEPTWPTVAGGIVQEFGNFDLNSNDSGTVNSSGTTVTSGPLTLGSTITDRYGDSSEIAGQAGTFTVASTSAVYALPLVTTWAPGTQYPTGSVVVPTTTQGAYINAIPNGDFEDGNDGNWAFSNGDVSIVDQESDAYQGDYCLKFALDRNTAYATMTTYGAVSPGQSVTATAYLDPNNEGGNLGMWLNLVWFDSNQTLLSTSKSSGGGVDGGADGFGYRKVSVTANAPANAAYVQAQIEAATGTSGINPGFADLVSWSLETPSAITNFVYEAIQATTGVSGTTQPAWPTVLGNTVDDGTVVWEAVGTSIITWQAIPIMQSGGAGVVETIQVSSSGTGYVAGTYDGVITSTNNSGVGCTLDIIVQTSSVTSATIAGGGSGYAVGDLLFVSNTQLGGTGSGFVATVESINSTSGEPDFPFQIGAIVYDASTYTDVNGTVHNTSMSWECIARNITDPNCPNSIPVALGASHVFAGDNDICDFSAAVNPTDWTSEDNAGYLPTGTNNYGNNPIAALALYRSNLIVFNSGGYQMWQIDPDPENMALLDAEPVGSTWPLSCQSVANDLLFLTEVGVRNLGIAGATANLQIGNTGQPIDPLIKAQLIAASTNGYIPRSLYYPGRGQYWIMFGPQAFVLTMNGNGIKSWSRYIFPNTITDWTLNSGVLYMRDTNNVVMQFDYDTLIDYAGLTTSSQTVTVVVASADSGFVTGWGSNYAGGFGNFGSINTSSLRNGLQLYTVYITTQGGGPGFEVIVSGKQTQNAFYRVEFSDGAGVLYTLNTAQAFSFTSTTENTLWYWSLSDITKWIVGSAESVTFIGVSASSISQTFSSTMQWPYLDMGTLGAKKMLAGVDIVGVGSCAMQIAYMQSDPTTFSDNANFSTCSNVTSSYIVSIADTLPGTPIPLPLNAPSYSLILHWNSDQPGLEAPNSQSWEWDGANLWMADQSGIGGM